MPLPTKPAESSLLPTVMQYMDNRVLPSHSLGYAELFGENNIMKQLSYLPNWYLFFILYVHDVCARWQFQHVNPDALARNVSEVMSKFKLTKKHAYHRELKEIVNQAMHKLYYESMEECMGGEVCITHWQERVYPRSIKNKGCVRLFEGVFGTLDSYSAKDGWKFLELVPWMAITPFEFVSFAVWKNGAHQLREMLAQLADPKHPRPVRLGLISWEEFYSGLLFNDYFPDPDNQHFQMFSHRLAELIGSTTHYEALLDRDTVALLAQYVLAWLFPN